MTENKRIFLNIIATYGRSLYALVLGLVCGRWALLALGEVDYGLLGVIGGLTIFISYFNTIIVGAIGRFYAVAVGQERSDAAQGVEECHKWFSISVAIQIIWPTILLLVGYPIGIWAIFNFLTIPADRMADCVWVWRFTCVTSYISMITVPWNAMYRAKQYIAELTIYSFVTMTLTACFNGYIVSHPGRWMVAASLWGGLLGIIPNVIIAWRGHRLFDECRFSFKYLKQWAAFKELSSYAFWNAWGILGAYIQGQGTTIVINKFFGPRINAGAAIGTNVSGHCNALASSLEGALNPAIYNAWGSGDHDHARRLAFRACKIGVLLVMIFALPLMLEIDEVLLLWLSKPPSFAAEMCIFVLIHTMLAKSASGHQACIDANGVIARFQTVDSIGRIATLPIYIGLIFAGLDVHAVGAGLIATILFCVLVRVYYAKKLCAMSIGYWVKRVMLPLALVAFVANVVGLLPRLFMAPSFLRVCCTTGIVEMAILPLIWFGVLDASERAYFAQRFEPLVKKIRGLGK